MSRLRGLQPFGSLGKYLVGMLGGFFDYREHLVQERVRDVAVEKIAHRIDEIDCRLSARQRLGDALTMQREFEAIFIPDSADQAEQR